MNSRPAGNSKSQTKSQLWPISRPAQLRTTKKGQLIAIAGAVETSSTTAQTSLTRKRSLVQSQYRPPVLPGTTSTGRRFPAGQPGDYRPLEGRGEVDVRTFWPSSG
jgi:hypothetical protein